MKNSGNKSDAANLRQRAEESLKEKQLKTGLQLSEVDAMKLIHELEVHQIELELQNEELMLAKEQAEVATQKYTELYDFAPSGYFTLSKEGEITGLNLSGANMLGKERSLLKNSLLGFFVSSGTKPIFNLFLKKVFSSEIKESCEVALSRNGNSPMYIHLTGIVTENREQCHVTIVDITAQKRALELVEIANHQKNLILEAAGEGILGIDLAGNLTFVNPMAAEILGYCVEELPVKNSHQLFHHHHRDGTPYPAEDCPIYKTLRSGKSAFGEDYFWRKDGTGFPVGFSSLPIIEDYKITGAVVTFRDITVRKQMEEARQKSEEQFHSLYMNMIDGATLSELIYNDQGVPDDYVIIETNPAFGKQLGISSDSIIGKTGREAYGESEPPFLEIYARVTQTGEPITFETYFQPLAKHYSILIYCPYKGRLATIFKDITQSRQAEKKILQNTERLESLVKILQYNFNQIQDILDYALDELIRITDSKIGNIYFYSEDNQIFELNAWSKEVMKECAVVNPQTIYSLDKAGFLGEAVRQRKPIINNNFEAAHPQKKGYPEGHVHLKKFLNIPVFFNNKIVAIAGVANKAEDYDQSDALQMTLLMSDVWKTTERIKLELALHASEERFRLLYENAKIGLYRTTPDGTIILANRALVKILGYPSFDELAKRNVEQDGFESPHQRKVFLEKIEQNGELENFESTWIRLDRTLVIVQESARAIRDSNGKTLYYDGTVENITERRRTEEALCNSEARYRLLFEVSADGILIADVETMTFKYANPTLCRMLGYTEKELTTLSLVDIHPKQDLQRIIAEFESLARGDKTLATDIPCLRKDGSIVYADINSTTITMDGRTCNMGLFRDITERKQAEEALINSENHARALLDAIPELMFRLNSQGVFLDYKAAKEDLAYQTESIIGLKLHDIMPPEFADLIDEKIRLALQTGQMQEFEYQLQLPARGLREYEARMGLCNTDEVIVIVRDVTERKKTGVEIELKNEQLLKLNAEKDKFFSIIAHDLRGPFSGFLGLTQIMAEDLPSLTMDEIQEISVNMRNSATNLFRLLENLLHWSRMQQGLIPFDPEIVQLLPFVDECIAMVLEPAKNKKIEITYYIPDDLEVFADSNLLQTVIRNLVSNAVKFTHKGGKISVSANATEDKTVEISVKDSGIGMNRAMVDNLFRLDVKTNRKGTEGEPSTGLGLFLCKEFIEKHGGKIWVESEEGKGTTFYFTIP